MKRLIAPLIAALSVSAASALHGGDYLSKGVMVVLLALIYAALGYWLAGWYGSGAGVAASLLFWFTYRKGVQAKAELDALYHADEPEEILKAYILPVAISCVLIAVSAYWAGWLYLLLIAPCLVSPIAPYSAAQHYSMGNGWDERRNRMMTELVTPGAVNSACVLLAICEGLRGWSY